MRLLIFGLALTAALSSGSAVGRDPDIWSQLKRGGHVILIRHGEVDNLSQSTSPDADFEGCEGQYNLTDAGRAQVKQLLESLATVGHRELKKSGVFSLPGFAKFVVVKKPATKARKGINPFTKEPTTFAAKPASKAVRARPIKAIKDAVA